MEALVAVGVASNLVQFVDFAVKLIRTSNELRHNAASAENREHVLLTIHLQKIATDINNTSQAIEQHNLSESPDDEALRPVIKGCCLLAQQLLQRLEGCGIRPGQTNTFTARARSTLKCMWNKREVQDISDRLERFRTEISLHLICQIEQRQMLYQTLLPKKEDLAALQDTVNELQSQIRSIQSQFDTRSGQLQSMPNFSILLGSEQPQSLSETARAVTVVASKQDEILEQLGYLKQDLATTQNQNDAMFDSLASFKTSNEELYNQSTQAAASFAEFGPAFQTALRTGLLECQQAILAGVEKSVKDALKTEFTDLQAILSPTVQNPYVCMANDCAMRDPRSETSDLDCVTRKDSWPSEVNHRAYFSIHEKKNIRRQDSVVLHSYFRIKTSKIGTMLIMIWYKVKFDHLGSSKSVFELAVNLVPNLSWFSTGCSATFRKEVDNKGVLQLNHHLHTYRVIQVEHDAIRAVERGDLEIVRMMLDERTVLPTDRDSGGSTLLHYAVAHGRLDILKALVARGADVNAQDGIGRSPLVWALLPTILLLNDEGFAILYYLQSLSSTDMSCLWEDHLRGTMITDLVIFPVSQTVDIQHKLKDWDVACKSVEVELNDHTCSFNESLVCHFSFWTPNSPEVSDIRHRLNINIGGLASIQQNARATIPRVFESIVSQGLASATNNPSINVPVSFTAAIMVFHLCTARTHSLIGDLPSPNVTFRYRGYFVVGKLAFSLNFLEHVIHLGISYRPDCIFDTYQGSTIYDIFWYTDWEDVWEGILEDHGIDPSWACEENERRKRVVLGQTSAHDVASPTQSAADIVQVKRRQTYHVAEH
ncbi:hypothetical protein BKA67DRAFT_677958 [Truncatella angustata]|uniref:Fungal N-terminal domain-containing protein n=1 Tax=Truncatella angustata TaxID=152316 RepID=A0A9P8ZXA0_9PEZI|nr:uncharacterized protein BKA67DRAFT_677958 [Truncatella angustata]KAH6652789.1 hypothetical protein BKA67DRAFT_677958 [Truncatella angustata]